jgi:3-oxoacyl-(acyl-carrier-protein) synthase
MTIIVTEMRAITALGDLDTTWDSLCAGRSGLEPLGEEPLENFRVGQVGGLHRTLGSWARLKDLTSLLEPGSLALPPGTDLIVATTKGAPDEMFVNEEAWSGQPWNLADELAEIFNISGERLTISAACASSTLAIINACQRLAARQSRAVLVIGVDLISRFVLAGFAGLKAISPDTCRPFDKKRTGLSLGEGAGLMLLTSDEFAREEKLAAIAEISGWGSACDANHITAPCRKASGLIETIKQCVDTAGEIGGVNAHGTGTVFNDSMELTAFKNIWTKPPPCHSVKGAIGHCLGAAGVIEAAISIKSLQSGKIPPTIGLREAEDDFAMLQGEKSQELRGPSILTCNSGFGGINAGVVFKRSRE